MCQWSDSIADVTAVEARLRMEEQCPSYVPGLQAHLGFETSNENVRNMQEIVSRSWFWHYSVASAQ